MATTKTSSERINLSVTKEERALLEKIAGVEDREVTYLAAWFMRWALQQYQNLDMTLMEMRNADYDNLDRGSRVRARIRLKLREGVATNNHVPEIERKRA